MNKLTTFFYGFFGLAITAMALGIGTQAAEVYRFRCQRTINTQQGQCRSQRFMLFTPWQQQVREFPLDRIVKAETINSGELHSIILRQHKTKDQPIFITESITQAETMTTAINSFLTQPQNTNLQIKTGGDPVSTIALLSFGGLGLWLMGVSFRAGLADRRLS